MKLVRKNLAIVVIDSKMDFWFTFNIFDLRVHFTISGNLTIAGHQVAVMALVSACTHVNLGFSWWQDQATVPLDVSVNKLLRII